MDDDERRVKIFKALSDPTRLQIIKLLNCDVSEMNCGDIGLHFSLSKPNSSYHLTTLFDAGLLHSRKDGQTKFVTLNREVFERYLPGFLHTL